MLNVPSWFRSIFFTIPLIIASTLVMGITVMAGALLGGRAYFQDRCAHAWVRMLLAASFVRVTVRGLEKLDRSQTYIFCSNHLSYMDPPIIVACLRHPICFIAKKSLFAIPVFGWALRAAGHVPIDRENVRNALRSLEKAEAKIRAGASVIVFPEGGRSLDGRLQPFLRGAFRLAIETQAPVVPIALAGTREILAPGSIHIHGGRVQLMVGDPIETRGMSAKDRDALAATARQRISEMLAGTESCLQ